MLLGVPLPLCSCGVIPLIAALLSMLTSCASNVTVVNIDNGFGAAVAAATSSPKIAREQSPNLIADLTSKMGRTPQRRLEQMIDFDEEQAAAILKQWMRGARRA